MAKNALTISPIKDAKLLTVTPFSLSIRWPNCNFLPAVVVVVVVVVVFPSTIWRTVTLGSRNKAASQLSKLSALDNNLFSVKSRPYLS